MPLEIFPVAPAPATIPATTTQPCQPGHCCLHGLIAPPPGEDNGTLILAAVAGLDGRYRSRDLYARYVSICEETGRLPLSSVRFGRKLGILGYISIRSATTRLWLIKPS